jgi:hypothetical protein
MIEIFPSPQLRLSALSPLITGALALVVFALKVPAVSVFLIFLAALGLAAILEGFYLLTLVRKPTIILDGYGLSVRSQMFLRPIRRLPWDTVAGSQRVRGHFIELATTRGRPFRIWAELVDGGPMALSSAIYEMELHRSGIQGQVPTPASAER